MDARRDAAREDSARRTPAEGKPARGKAARGKAARRELAREELARLRAEGERIAEALLAMDDHPGHGLLRGATTGATRDRWREIGPAMVLLWQWFDAYREVLARVDAAPGPDEVARLVTEPVVVLDERPVPVRTLTGPAVVGERVALGVLVDRMKEQYAQVMAVLTEVREAWARRLELLDPLPGRLAGLDSPAVERLRAEVAAAHA
ncbi:hypothetical protein, partial [Saccharothrix hoggarensis]